jgi:hypothetical protein
MIRNEADIIVPFLNQASELFDKMLVVDVRSTDGTREILERSKQANIELYSIEVEEKYQSAILNLLTERAFVEGADWVFPIDGDEFLDIDGRREFEEFLTAFPHNVMRLRWCNLVPTRYGKFSHFDASQEFYVTGLQSRFSKIAIARRFAELNPNFNIDEGSHAVFEYGRTNPQLGEQGLTMLHIPVRSEDRFRYKITNAQRTLESKHNRAKDEGHHVGRILELLSSDTSGEFVLNSIAAGYGVNEAANAEIDPEELGWTKRKLPQFLSAGDGSKAADLSETEAADKAMIWKPPPSPPGIAVSALLKDRTVQIVPQAVSGEGKRRLGKFSLLPHRELDADLGSAVAASFRRIEYLVGSAWSGLVPSLFALIALHRPRRFVELGVHNGMSFFAACQMSEVFRGIECVAIDSWEGDTQAGFYSSDVFDQFRKTLRSFPDQYFIRSYFEDALPLFEDGSIDLLHIDGFHSYDAVKKDFEQWLPKMSSSGIVMFHDTNVHRPDFGVWQLWGELSRKYPSMELHHSHGLGILNVGKQNLLDVFDLLKDDKAIGIARTFLAGIGEMSLAYRTLEEKVNCRNAQLLDLWKAKRQGVWERWRACRNIAQSGEFDAAYYLDTYPDVKLSGIEPLRHYVKYGVFELRNPSPSFDTAKYLTENLDVMNSNLNPFEHYLRFGKREGRIV